MNPPLYVVGLDLGQTADYTALSILERTETADGSHYAVRHLERFQRVPYTEIGKTLQALLSRPPLPGSTLAVDQTGVGRAVIDILVAMNLPAAITPVTITSGHKTTCEADGWRVPKKELVSTVRVLLESGRLVFAPKLKLADIARRELEKFRAKISVDTGNESFEAWRERDHDDVVLSVAMAGWAGERALCGPWETVGHRDNISLFDHAPPGVFWK
jgi:hypothetical protein